jgi:hypothetical protein
MGHTQPHQDDPESAECLPTRPPAEQRVRQHERGRDARQSGRVARDDPCHVEDDQGAERDRHRRERMRPPPQQAECDHDADG